jgi:hypothetical protein
MVGESACYLPPRAVLADLCVASHTCLSFSAQGGFRRPYTWCTSSGSTSIGVAPAFAARFLSLKH